MGITVLKALPLEKVSSLCAAMRIWLLVEVVQPRPGCTVTQPAHTETDVGCLQFVLGISPFEAGDKPLEKCNLRTAEPCLMSCSIGDWWKVCWLVNAFRAINKCYAIITATTTLSPLYIWLDLWTCVLHSKNTSPFLEPSNSQRKQRLVTDDIQSPRA